MNSLIRQKLEEMVRPEKIEFQKRICKSNYPNLGIPLGELRTLAKKYSVSDINEKPVYYDEVLVNGLILANDKRPFLEKIDELDHYLSLADSWALIDSFCSTFRLKKEELEPVFQKLLEYLNSDDEFSQRFAVVMFLTQFLKLDKNFKKLSRRRNLTIEELSLDEETRSIFLERILEHLDQKYSYYNTSMAVAWFLAEALLFEPKTITEFIEKSKLDNKTINRMVDKVRQSRNPSKEVKDYYLKFKRKNL